MPVINGVGCKRVRTISSPLGEKNYLKVKEATDLSVKNYINVIEADGNEKNCVNVLKVTHDNPKDYILVNYVDIVSQHYRFDGGDDYITIPQVDLAVGDTMTFKFISPTEGSSGLIFSKAGVNTPEFGFYLGKYVISDNCAAVVDGEPVVAGNNFPRDGKEHEVVITIVSDCHFNQIGVGWSQGNFFGGSVYDMYINAASGNRFYAINDGWSSNPVIRDTIGGQDGMAVNFQESGWFTV